MSLLSSFGLVRRSVLRKANRKSRRRLQIERVEERLAPSVTASFAASSDWGAGFVAAIRIDNDQATAISNWRLEFDFPYQITDIWNGRIASHVGHHYAIDNAGYNGTIGPNSVTEFGFVGAPGNVTTPPTNYVLNGIPLDGRPTPKVSIGSVTVSEADTSNATASFPVTLGAESSGPVTVRFATENGTATSGNDFFAASGTLTFQPGETQKNIDVAILGDLIDENDETFTVTLSDPVGATLGTASGIGTIVDNDSPPGLTVSDVTVQEPNRPTVDPGYFRTSGNQIVDAAGRIIRIAGVNWFGMEGTNYAPHGLWARNYRDMMNQMAQVGFNTIRLPYSNQLFDATSQTSGVDYVLNPDLRGLNGLGILDMVVDYAGQIGLRIILDHHRSDAGAGAEGSGLWYTSEYPESRWISDWQMLAARFAGNPTVIGADLHNEPHGQASWGNGDVNDWRLAAERAGNAILSVNPNWLIIAEGVQSTSTGSTWWGGNLSNAGTHPVRLNVSGRLVYSPHDYPASIYPQPWFSDPNYPNNLYGVWDKYWGYLFRQRTAPLLIGEFGTKLETTSDQFWLATITKYLDGDLNGDGNSDLSPGQQGPSWTWWSWNPNSGDTGGILQDDWISVHQDKVDKLTPIGFPWAGGSATATATFTINLSSPSAKTVQVNYATADGVALANQDYTSKSGTLTFAPGETSKTVPVLIFADGLIEPTENLYLRLSSPSNATLDDGEGEAMIRDAGDPPPPTISIGNARITEGDAGTNPLSFTVTLSAPSNQTIIVQYQTEDNSALAGQDYTSTRGSLTFNRGLTSQTISIPIIGDDVAEAIESFRVRLSNPTNATLGGNPGTGTIIDNDSGAPGVRVTYNNRDDWGTGFVAGMAIINEGQEAINGWTLEFDFNHNITNIWNAEIVSHVGTRYVIRSASWNATISANGRVEFGFQGEPGNAIAGPTDIVFNGIALP